MSDLQKALDRFEQSLPVLDSLDGEVSGTHKDERDNYLMDAWLLVAAARAHLSCPDLTSQTRQVAGQNEDGSLNPDLDYTETRWVSEWRAVKGDTE